jgi:DnaJ-class molecular chaperone
MPRQLNYYRILNVALSADQAQIQHAYRTQAKRYHPDRVPPEHRDWARAQMARINAAYEVLGDPARRAAYDRTQGYTAPGQTNAAQAEAGPPRPSRQQTDHGHNGASDVEQTPRVRVRRERGRRERMSRQRARLLGSASALGVVLLGALYRWRQSASGLPGQRWSWALLLLAGLSLVLIVLGSVR